MRWFARPGRRASATSTPHRTTASGLSERRLGESLRSYPRDELVVSTKVGRLLEPRDTSDAQDPEGFVVPATHRRVWDFSRDGVLRSIEASLGRLALDRIDLVLIHDPDDHAREALEAAAPTLSQLRSKGSSADTAWA